MRTEELGRRGIDIQALTATPAQTSYSVPADLAIATAKGINDNSAEIGRHAVEGLRRRGGDRLDVDPHAVHVFEPLLDRRKLHAIAFGLLAVDLPRALIGEVMARLPVHAETGILDHLLGLGGQQMAMDVDREPFAAGMHRPRKAA